MMCERGRFNKSEYSKAAIWLREEITNPPEDQFTNSLSVAHIQHVAHRYSQAQIAFVLCTVRPTITQFIRI